MTEGPSDRVTDRLFESFVSFYDSLRTGQKTINFCFIRKISSEMDREEEEEEGKEGAKRSETKYQKLDEKNITTRLCRYIIVMTCTFWN